MTVVAAMASSRSPESPRIYGVRATQAGYNYDETVSTLRYANRAKNIKNKPKINEDPKDAMLREFQDEIAKLKAQLQGKGTYDENGEWQGLTRRPFTPSTRLVSSPRRRRGRGDGVSMITRLVPRRRAEGVQGGREDRPQGGHQGGDRRRVRGGVVEGPCRS